MATLYSKSRSVRLSAYVAEELRNRQSAHRFNYKETHALNVGPYASIDVGTIEYLEMINPDFQHILKYTTWSQAWRGVRRQTGAGFDEECLSQMCSIDALT